MLTSRKSAWFERVFAAYNRNLFGRRFEGLRAGGLNHLREGPRGVPLVLYANHSSWWDGLAAFALGRACGLNHYVMMEERQLARYALFRRLGAFSIEPSRPREAARSVAYAADLLRGTERALWIFPQGATLPNDARPIRFHSGVAHVIARAGGALAVPVAMRYEFLEEFRPEAFALVGPVEHLTSEDCGDPKHLASQLADRLTATLDQLRGDILDAKFDCYEELIAPSRRERAGQ